MNFNQVSKTVRNKIVENKLIISNLSYLSILRIFTLLMPLVSYPYLIRVLGPEKYGIVIFVQSVIAFFTIFVNYGFNISATKEVSIYRDSVGKLNEIVNSVLIIKSILFIFSLLILITFIAFFPKVKEHYLLYIFSLGLTFSEVIFPIWYFQGVEKMKYITYINIISRTIFTLLIFILIKKEGDYIFVPLLNSVGAVIGGSVAIYFLYCKEKMQLVLPKTSNVFSHFKSSTPFFLSRASAVINIRTNALVIGHFLGFREVAYYDLASKIAELFKVPFSLINQSIYPNVAKSRNMALVKKLLTFTIITSTLMFVGIAIWNKYLILLLGGEDMLPSKYVIIILALTIPLSGITYFLGNTVLVVMNKVKQFNMSVINGTLAYLLLITVLFLFKKIDLYTVTWSVVIVEFYIASYRFYYSKKFKLI